MEQMSREIAAHQNEISSQFPPLEPTQARTAVGAPPPGRRLAQRMAQQAPLEGPPPPVETGIPTREAVPAFDQMPHEAPPPEARPPAPQTGPVTAAVTPQELRITAMARAELNEAAKTNPGMKQILDRLDQLPPKVQAQKATQLLALMQREQGQAVGTSTQEARIPFKRPTLEGGLQARSKGDLARKSGALEAAKNAATAVTSKLTENRQVPTSVEDRTALQAELKPVLEAAQKANGGKHPTESYRPNVKPIEWQWYRAAQKVAANPTPKNVRDYVTLETAVRNGATAETAKDFQQTGHIQGDIENRPQLSEAAAEARTAQAAENARYIPRETFERLPPMKNSKGEVGQDQTYVTQQNDLRDWLNELPDREYEKLQSLQDDSLRFLVEDSNDPAELHSMFRQELAQAGGKRPTEDMEPVPAEEAPPSRITPITNAEDLARFEPTEPGAKASKGRVLDKNSEEFKRLAAQYGSPVGPESKLSPGEQKAQYLQKNSARLASEIDNQREGWADAVDGTPQGFKNKIRAFMGDEGGKMDMPHWLRDTSLPEWRDYAESLGRSFKGLLNNRLKEKIAMQARLAAAPTLTPDKWRAIYRAGENRTINQLSPELQQVYQDHVLPLKKEYDAAMQRMVALNAQHNLGLDLPDLTKPGVSKDWMPRIQKGKQMYDKAEEDAFDPVVGRGVGHWASTFERRSYYALQDASGNRMTLQVEGKPGAMEGIIWRGGKSTKIGKLPSSFTADIGDTVNLKQKGQTNTWTVDHATADEIAKATGGKVEYHENPMMAFGQQLEGAKNALANADLIVSVRNDPRWKANTTTDIQEAQEKGYDLAESKLKQLGQDQHGKQVYMPRNMRWALDDFAQPGFGNDWGVMRNGATGLLKTLFTFTPLRHPINELDLFAVGRGFDWAKPSGYASLWRNGINAYKSVNTQDAIQKEIRDAGGKTMLASVLVRDMWAKQAKRFGMDISQNPSQWDPIARIWRVTSPELGRTAYNLATDPTWRLSDYLYTTRYLELREQGYSPQEAVKEVEHFISNYDLPTTVGAPNTPFGRFLAQSMGEPVISAFGRYKYGLFRTYAHVMRNIAMGNPQERQKAVGNLLAGLIMLGGVYEAADKVLQMISGNPGAEMTRAGASTLPYGLYEMATGEKSPPLMRLATPSIPAKMGYELVTNKDWRGQPIFPAGASPGESAALGADWAAQNLVPPFSTIERAAMKPDTSVGGFLRDMVGEQIGAKFPSERAQRYEAQAPRRNLKEWKQRMHHPTGVLPELYYRGTQ